MLMWIIIFGDTSYSIPTHEQHFNISQNIHVILFSKLPSGNNWDFIQIKNNNISISVFLGHNRMKPGNTIILWKYYHVTQMASRYDCSLKNPAVASFTNIVQL